MLGPRNLATGVIQFIDSSLPSTDSIKFILLSRVILFIDASHSMNLLE